MEYISPSKPGRYEVLTMGKTVTAILELRHTLVDSNGGAASD